MSLVSLSLSLVSVSLLLVLLGTPMMSSHATAAVASAAVAGPAAVDPARSAVDSLSTEFAAPQSISSAAQPSSASQPNVIGIGDLIRSRFFTPARALLRTVLSERDLHPVPPVSPAAPASRAVVRPEEISNMRMTHEPKHRHFMAELRERLHRLSIPMQVELSRAAGDGNCFFSAVSYNLFGSQDVQMYLRAICYDYLNSHRDELAARAPAFAGLNFIEGWAGTPDEYYDAVVNDFQFAAEPEVNALAHALRVNIQVFSKLERNTPMWEHTFGSDYPQTVYLAHVAAWWMSLHSP